MILVIIACHKQLAATAQVSRSAACQRLACCDLRRMTVPSSVTWDRDPATRTGESTSTSSIATYWSRVRAAEVTGPDKGRAAQGLHMLCGIEQGMMIKLSTGTGEVRAAHVRVAPAPARAARPTGGACRAVPVTPRKAPRPVAAPRPAPTRRAHARSSPPPPRAIAPQARPRARPALAPASSASRPHVASPASA